MMRWLTVLIFTFFIASNIAAQTENSTSLYDQALIFHDLSDSSQKSENYSKSIKFKLQELELLLKFNQMIPIAQCGAKLGLLYYHLGNYHESLKCFEKSSNFYKNTKNLVSYATIKVNSANVYTRLGKYREAINQMQLAEEIYAEDTITFAKQLVGLYTNLGLAYFDLPNLDTAAYYYKKASIANQSANSQLYEAVILNNQGDIMLQKDSAEIAYMLYTKSLKIAEKLNYILLVGTTKLNLGRLHTQKKNYTLALADLREANSIYKNIESLFFLAETNRELSNCFYEMGQTDSSLHHLKIFNQLEDSLMGSQTLDRIANLEMEVAMKEEESKLKLVKQEKELAETESRYQKTYLYLMLGLILMGLVIAFLLIRTLRTSLEKNKLEAQHLGEKQQLLQKEVDFKKKEIENFSTYMLEKNNILGEVQSRLNAIKKEIPTSNLVIEALVSINHNLHIDQDRKELDLKIDQAHQEFMGRLLNKHPKLSKTEQRLCSLLLMDLSGKDISNIMNVEPDSIKKSRYRLRKKLELEPKADLTVFLKSI
ncbi:MAG: tetratricopeptide (TPR) repeat protein [Arenicella sp.]|jgi:tetratricopeptide (TPR) repeat protein